MDKVMEALNEIKPKISQQAFMTIRGQIKSGDINGAWKGISRIKRKLESESAKN